MLIHPDAGIVLWTPIAILGAAGLIIGSIHRRMESVLALACVLLVLLSVQFQPNWWGGCAFGPRFFTHLFVFWSWGLLELSDRIRREIFLPLISICAAWTFFLFNIFFINAASADFRIMLRANKCKRSTGDMITNAVSEYQSALERNETANPISFWFESLGKGRFPTILPLTTKSSSAGNKEDVEEGE
jgi:hypothetical protein